MAGYLQGLGKKVELPTMILNILMVNEKSKGSAIKIWEIFPWGQLKKTGGLQFKLRRFSPSGPQKGGGLLLKFHIHRFPHRVAN